MTKLLHILSGVLIWFLVALLGGALLHANIPGVTVTAFDFLPPLYSWKAAGEGAVLILLALLYVVTFAPRRPKVRYLSFKSEGGDVSISVNAVRDFIRKLSGEFSAVASVDPKIRAEKNQIHIDLNVGIVSGARIPEISQALQSRVRESLRSGLGIDEVGEIKVRVREIVGEPEAPDRGGWRS